MSSATIPVRNTDTAVPFTFYMEQGQTGETITVRLRDAETLNSYVDFADGTFKTSGWTTQTRTLTEIDSGLYGLVEDFSAITFPHERLYVAEFVRSGTPAIVAIDYYNLRTVDDVANIASDVTDIRRALYNRLDINDALDLLELYDDAGTSVLQQWALTDKDGNAVTLTKDFPANRGTPQL